VEWQQIGAAGDWASVVGALAVHGRLWTLDKNGSLTYETLDGKRVQVSRTGAFAGSRIWLSLGANLYIVVGGTMYGGDPEHGPWRMVCDPEWWADTDTFINMNGYIWSVDHGGRLFRTNASCISDRVGEDDIRNLRMLAAMGGKLWAVDDIGLNVLDPEEGKWRPVDDPGAFEDVVRLIGSPDYLWALDRAGTLGHIDAADHWQQVGADREFHDVKFFFVIDGALYLVRDGTLYKRSI
jgi:hypothetical protein